jgi:ABC-2 type transport system ATP-binding protein
VSFSIEKGELVGLLGLNGAGKTTLMNILTGCLSPTSGAVSVGGYDIARSPRQAKSMIGYLQELPAFYADMRVSEYLAFVCELKNIKKNRQKHVGDVCRLVGIDSVSHRIIRNLSKGYKQRVGFAQALIGDPTALFLDEPTVGLDPSQIMEIRSLIKDLAKTSTVLISSHILQEVRAVCDRVIVLSNGRIAADAATNDLNSAGTGCPRRMTVRIKGGADEIENALTRASCEISIKRLSQREQGAWDFEIEADPGHDYRESVFRALAAADLPLLQTLGVQNELEDMFLGLVRQRHNDI